MLNDSMIEAVTTLHPLVVLYAFYFPKEVFDEEVLQEIEDFLNDLGYLGQVLRDETEEGDEVYIAFEIEANMSLYAVESGVEKIIRDWAKANNNYAVSPK